jgi:hypothetical protein
MTNIELTKNNWEATKVKLQQQFERLANNDIPLLNKKQDEMLLKIQVKLGKTREEIRKLISV